MHIYRNETEWTEYSVHEQEAKVNVHNITFSFIRKATSMQCCFSNEAQRLKVLILLSMARAGLRKENHGLPYPATQGGVAWVLN